MIPALLILLVVAVVVAAAFLIARTARRKAASHDHTYLPAVKGTPHTGLLNDDLFATPEADQETEKGRGATPPPAPDAYVIKDSLLSAAERTFHYAVAQVLPPNTQIFVQVALSAILLPRPGSKTWSRDRNRIGQKIADFVVCDQWCRPLAVIELDDSSHRRKARADRDELVDSILQSAGLPILHVVAAGNYDLESLRKQLHSIIPRTAAAR